jgi:hypothetical protein
MAEGSLGDAVTRRRLDGARDEAGASRSLDKLLQTF